ncbi:peptide deformylase [Deinococcus cellulosilyticus]|uniref:Peptide deformylase n=1 Tax=Deinococcus cellulosilyticus (strain DSM 18568 / NBRC 106333 / KACC 11606 / 5516J-15) TaxID=1223518 RepID=A0A511N8Q3_DEIC1|nr:peptide deformylase [Deinococcus cellulosilyticus]GEM48917.1 peptide deformylase [Deinococcus cellulosilyticus NBRC 106333 = KACC 11606]
MIYPIRLYGDPVLRQKARAVTDFTQTVQVPGFEPVSLIQLAENMLDTMYNAHGVGIAAPQIGLGLRMFVMAEYADDEEEGEAAEDSDPRARSRVLRELVVINPVLEPLNKKKNKNSQEGCLSVPGIYEEGIARFSEMRLTYQDAEGNTHTEENEDFIARVWQHENDHLNGKFFLDHLPKHITDEHRTELAIMQRKAKAFLKELKEKGW